MWSSPVSQPSIYALQADFFRALGHPVRVRLLQLLREAEGSVGMLRDALDVGASATSQHLAVLRVQGLVTSRREGKMVYYRVEDPRALELLELAKEIIVAALEEHAALLGDRLVGDYGPRVRD